MKKICETCKTVFVVKDHKQGLKRRFCSKSCSSSRNSRIDNETLQCKNCKQTLPKSHFWKSSQYRKGCLSICGECVKNKEFYNRSFDPKLIGNKVCTKCNLSKDITDFYVNKYHTDGRASECKDCNRIF